MKLAITFGMLTAVFVGAQTAAWCQTPSAASVSPAEKIDALVDSRFDAAAGATKQLLTELDAAGLGQLEDLEKALRARRTTYPDNSKLVGKFSRHDVSCLHVDYESEFMLFVPADFVPDKQASLVVVGHGGNSSMSAARARSTAVQYLSLYAEIGRTTGAIVVAPVSGRGWGHIGNSLIFSTISRLQRMFPIDPDRIYITGQSMGGHLTYRAAISLPDRWGAVSPHSGGYDFVEKKTIGNLINVPGFAIWGVREPYGINTDNRTNRKWAEDHKLNWRFTEKNGGHTIYRDELPNVARFFADNPRNLYRDTVYIRSGGAMKFTKPWGIKGWPEHTVYTDTRPLRWNIRHWLEIEPRPELGEPLTIMARNKGNNEFLIVSQNVRKLSVYVHPKMIDFDKPVSITVNGEQLFNEKATRDPEIMFDLTREFDDRGRIFWARIDLEVKTDKAVEILPM